MKANDIAVFSDTYNLKSLIKKPTGHKNPNKPSCIDLILTNKPRSFYYCYEETSSEGCELYRLQVF